MANKIAGLTIEIGGETAGLTKALSGVNKQSRDLQAELRNVDKLLKLDPKNTELITQNKSYSLNRYLILKANWIH